MSREIGLLHFGSAGSSGKIINRNILCLHTLSTLCPIDFEPRLTLRTRARPPARAGLQLKMHSHGPTSVSSALF